jgi:hypothetical protein
MVSETPREVPFSEHLDNLRWFQGDHIIIAAPTKCGKTTLAQRLASKRSHTVVFLCKHRDDTIKAEYSGWTRYYDWPKHVPAYDDRILLWPKPETTIADTRAKQRAIFGKALDAINVQGRRCVIIDEGLYTCDPQGLGLGNQIGTMFYFGRSNYISMGILAQRPAWLPKIIYSSASHAWVSRTTDNDDIKRLADFGGIDSKETGVHLKNLKRRQDFLYLNPQGDARSVIINTRR